MSPAVLDVDRLIEQLGSASRRAGMRHDDPLAPLLQAFATSIRYVGERTARSEAIAAETSRNLLATMQEARTAADAEAERFRSGLAQTEADTIQRIAAGIADSADQALARRIDNHGRLLTLGAALILFAISASCLGGGYWIGHTVAVDEIQETEVGLKAAFSGGLQQAAQWLRLMQWNNVELALSRCSGPLLAVDTGRRSCTVPLWLDPPN